MAQADRSFPYLAIATVKYKSPHKQDLTFAKGETIRVTGIAPKTAEQDDEDDDEDDDWLVGESLDGSRHGTFPGGFVEPSDEQDQEAVEAATGVANLAPVAASAQPSSVTETAQPAEEAPLVPAAAREAAQQGKTETAGFGAPLPPRPASSDDEEDEVVEETPSAKQVETDKTAATTVESKATEAASAVAAPEPATAPEGAVDKEAPSGQATAPATTDAVKSPTAASAAAGQTSIAPPPSAKSPPVVAKPAGMSSSFRDRLAAFNKPAESAPPPPVPRGKPGGWKRPAPAPDAPKPVLPGQAPTSTTAAAPAAPAKKPEPQNADVASEPVRPKGDSGFSAADAQSSIKMSLKERMAALQRGETARSGTGEEGSTASQPPKPAAAPGRIAPEKRNIALAGMGLAPSETPARSQDRDSAKSIDEVSAATGEAVNPALAPADDVRAATTVSEQIAEPGEAPVIEDAPEKEPQVTDEGEERSELTEEEQEAERRAAIAKRMAALGGRRMGGGPALFGAPAPPGNPIKKASISSSSEPSTSVEPGIVTDAGEDTFPKSPSVGETDGNPLSPASDVSIAEPSAVHQSDGQPQTLAVPRRVAPPRRKRTAAAAGTGVGAGAATAAAVAAASSEGPKDDDQVDQTQAAGPDSTASVEEEITEPAPETTAQATTDTGAAVISTKDIGEGGLAQSEDTLQEPDAPTELASEEVITESQQPSNLGLHSALLGRDDDELSTAAVTPSGYESEDARIKEHERQLEEYLKGNEASRDDELERVVRDLEPDLERDGPSGLAEQEAQDVVTSDADMARQPTHRQDAATPKPPSRPSSTRPPIPQTSLPPAPIDTAVSPDEGPAGFKSPLSPNRVHTASPAQSASANRRSFVPPVPRTSVPPPPRGEGVASPPLLPRSPPPVAPELAQPSMGSVAADASEVTAASGPVLAAPRARMAMPSEDSEDEELLQAADAANYDQQPPTAGEPQQLTHEDANAQEDEAVELTEEEQEAQRRANLAHRMARLGGQRIGGLPGMAPPPIMGAPMPSRRKPVPVAADQEEERHLQPQVTSAAHVDALEASVDPQFEEPDEASEPSVRLASPPPVPVSPPPKPLSPAPTRALPSASGDSSAGPPPLPPGRPGSAAPLGSLDEAAATLARSSTPAAASGSGDGLNRRTSMRPAVPQGLQSPPVRSRDSLYTEGQLESVHDNVTEEDGARETPPQPFMAVCPPGPPALPQSPPPRPLSQAPPLPGQVSVPLRDASSHAAQAPPIEPQQQQQTYEDFASPVSPPPQQTLQQPVAHSTAPSQGSTLSTRQSSRDLDLMPSSRWWRHGLSPLRLPPTVAGRPDAILYADTSSSTKRGKTVHSADIYVLFEDYSTTTISLSFQEDDAEESATSLTQTHNFPPPKPSAELLKTWASEVGASLARSAQEAAKSPSPSPIGDGTSRSFAVSLINSLGSALPPVGTTYGGLILTQVGPTVMETGSDEPRPGDVVVCSAAELKGKRGLAPYHATYGSQAEPTVGVVVECEAKKNKLRCVMQNAKGGGKGHKVVVEEVSLRLDDLKSGVVKVFRVPKREGWLEW